MEDNAPHTSRRRGALGSKNESGRARSLSRVMFQSSHEFIQDAVLMRVPASTSDASSFLVGVFDGHGHNGEAISAFCQVKRGFL